MSCLLANCCRGRKFNELNIPHRPPFRSDVLQRLLATASPSADENTLQQFSKPSLEPSFKPSPVADTQQERASLVSGPPNEHTIQQVPSTTEPPTKPGTSQPLVHPQETANGVLPDGDTAKHGQDHASDASIGSQHPTVASKPVSDPIPGFRKPVSPTPERRDAEQHQIQDAPQNHAITELAVGDGAEPMDVDGLVTTQKQDDNARLLSIPTLSVDHSRAPDALSSPASTTHTATTPAIHEASTDTSPDNEGPQYIETEEEKAEESSTPTAHQPSRDQSRDGVTDSNDVAESEQAQSPAQLDALGRVVDGVEAQLLEETAAASMAKGNEEATRSQAPTSPTAVAERTLTSFTEPLPQTEALSKLNSSQDVALRDGAGATPGATRGEPALVEREGRQGSPVVPTEVHVERLPRIDTSVPPFGQELPTETPTIEVSAPTVESPVPERAVTRISSGALRQKSVSELLGEPPKEASVAPLTPGPSGSPRSLQHMQDDDEPPSRAISIGEVKSLASRTKKRRRSIPTVVFGKQPKKLKPSNDTALVSGQPKEGLSMNDDYFIPLFLDAFSRSDRSWMKPVDQLLNQADKTVSTPDQYVPIQEHQACRILRRVYHLQQQDKWSLRQPQRCPEPTRPPSHQDVLLQEMKWMRTDFREEGKWKRAVARNLAHDCAEWVAASPEERLALQVNAVVRRRTASTDVQMQDETGDAPEDQLPDLVHSDSPTANEDDSIEDQVMPDTIAPSAIFALPDDEVVFSLRPSQIADQLLEELPMYGSALKVPKFDVTVPEFDPDAHWKRPALPLSKFVEGKMVLSSPPPPKKRSRYSYQAEDDDDEDDQFVFGPQPDKHVVLPPVDANVGLFNPEMKPIRDRLHAGHQFRPPTEYPMPLQSFYECRAASQWTLAEDDELKSLVREYSYNWSLISSAISSKSVFSSAPERRTPWECFERWVQLEGLPADMGKTQYFRTYQNRIDAAQRVIHQLNQNAQQTVGPNGAVTPAPRRRQTLSIRVERRRNQKHLALIDAMRKLAKKREVAIQKTQHAAAMAANRKQNEGQRPVGPPQTPRDYSLMRWERDQQLAEKMAQLAQRQHDIAQQRRVCFRLVTDDSLKKSTNSISGAAREIAVSSQ